MASIAARSESLLPRQGWPDIDAARQFQFTANPSETFRSGLVGRRRLAAGVEVYRQGEDAPEFYLVNSGWMCLYRLLPDGRRHNVKFAMPGDLIGFSMAPAMPMDHSAISLTESAVSVLDRDAVMRRYPKDAELMARLGCYMAREHALALQQLTSVTRATAIERVTHLLLELFIRSRRRLPEAGDRMRIPLTQEQIGDAVGLSAVHVNRMLAELREEGILTLHSGQMVIAKPDRMSNLSPLDFNAMLDYFGPPPSAGAVPFPTPKPAVPVTPTRAKPSMPH